MLRSVRNAMKGVVVWFFVALLIVAFALFGVPSLQDLTRRPAIKIGDVSVSAQEIQTEFNRFMITQQGLTEGGLSRADAIADGVPQDIVQSLVVRRVLEQEAHNLGLELPRSLVREILSNDERFQNPESQKFDVNVLANILQRFGMNVREFEQMIRSELMRAQLTSSLEGGVAPNAFVDALLARILEKREVAYLAITEDMAGIPEEPSPEKLKVFFEANAATFTAPEYRTFTLISLSRDEFRDGLEQPEDALRQFYEARRAALYEKPERRTIYQITYDGEGEARAAAQRLRDGGTIQEAAEARGLSLSALTYTDIVKESILDPTVADAAFSADLAEGGVSAPIEGLFGWTIVQVSAITPPETQAFEDVREELENQLIEQDVRRRIFDAIDAVEDARDAGESLAEAAEAAGGSVTLIGPVDALSFAPGGAIVADIPGEVLNIAFQLDEGEESEAEELGNEAGYFYVSLSEVTPPTLAAFETVEPEVESLWREDERTRRIARAVEQIRDAIAAGATLDEAATPFNAAPETVSIRRTESGEVFTQTFLETIFTADKSAVVSGASPALQAQTVAVIDDIKIDRAQANPTLRSTFAGSLHTQLGYELVDAYIASLRSDYDARVDQSQIDAIFAVQ